ESVPGEGVDDSEGIHAADGKLRPRTDEERRVGSDGKRPERIAEARAGGRATVASVRRICLAAIVSSAGDSTDDAVRRDLAHALIATVGDVDGAIGPECDAYRAVQSGLERRATIAGEAAPIQRCAVVRW